MSDFSDEMESVSTDLLTQFGEAVSFTRTTNSAYDPSIGTTQDTTVTAYSGFGVPVNFELGQIDGELVRENDLLIVVNKMTEVPLAGDTVVVSSVNYRVQRVMKTVVNGADILYDLQLRL